MKKPLLIAIGAALVVAAVAAQMWQSLRAERRQNEALAARIAVLEAASPSPLVIAPEPEPAVREAATESLAQQAGSPPVSTSSNAGAPGRSTSVAPDGPAVAATTPSPQVASGSQPAATPAAAGMLVTQQAADFALAMMRQMLLQQYPDIEQELGLTRAEADQFMSLLIRQQEQMGTESMAMFTGGGQQGAVDAQQLQRRLVEMEQAGEAEQAAMLGSRYPRWEEYQGVAAARTEVNQLRTTLNAGGLPLSDAQSAALVTAFAAQATRDQRDERQWMASPAALESPNMMVEQMQRAGASRQQLVDVAAGILNPDQLDQFRRQVDQQVAVMRATVGMLEGMNVPGQAQAAAPSGPY